MNSAVTQYQTHGGIAGHKFYFDNDVKFINIPKSASTAVQAQIHKFTKKFVVIREPYSRLHSCFKHVIEFENLTMQQATDYLTGQIAIDDHDAADAMMHFIPASFFIECSNLIDIQPYDVFKLENLEFTKTNANTSTEHDKIISHWIDNNREFVKNFYKQDIELYNLYE
jgi:hypothetical protein